MAIKKAVEAGELKRFHNLGPNGVNLYEVSIDRLKQKGDLRSPAGLYSTPLERRSPPEPRSDKGSVFKGSNSSLKIRKGDQAGYATHVEKAASNGYITCPDCGRYGGRCNCDADLQARFDRTMRKTLDAGKPGPARLASEEALRRAYAS
jgi:hypothetical protein